MPEHGRTGDIKESCTAPGNASMKTIKNLNGGRPLQYNRLVQNKKISVKEANKIVTGDLEYDTDRRITSVKDR